MPEKIVQTIIYDAHPAMFRAHPFWFVVYIILIPAFGLGLLLLLYWYIETRQKRVTVLETMPKVLPPAPLMVKRFSLELRPHRLLHRPPRHLRLRLLHQHRRAYT